MQPRRARCEQGNLTDQPIGNCVGTLLVITVFFVECALCVLHITRYGPKDDPCSADGCKERSWNRTKRVKEAAVEDPADQVGGCGTKEGLYKSEHF